MVWQDWAHLNKKYADVWLAGLGGGVFDGGDVLQSQGNGKPASGLGQLTFSQVQTLQDLLNLENMYRERADIPVTGVWDAATCLTVYYYTDILVNQGGQVDQFLFDFMLNNENAIADGCRALSEAAPPPPPPPPSNGVTDGNGGGGMAPMPGSNACFVFGDGTESCDCELVAEDDTGPHIAHFQEALNVHLVEQGYDAIPISSAWDALTCGANYAVRDTFAYDPSTNPWCPYGTNFNFPYRCEKMIVPEKKGASRAGMFAVGGLVLAAGLGGAYWIAQR